MNVMRRIQYRWILLFFLFNTIIVAFGVQGFEHGRVNNFRDQSVQIPIIYSYADPTLYADDLLIEARDSYVTWFYPMLGMLSRFFPLEILMLGLYVLAVGITVSAVYMLAETLFPDKGVGLFGVILWMAYFPNPGGDFIHSPFVTHSTFAIALALWAIVLICRKQYIGAAIILGITANINAMTSFFVTFMWAFSLLIDWRSWSWRLLRIPVVMAVMALPILLWRLSLPFSETSLDNFVSIIRIRLWYAVFPFSVSALLWCGFFALMALWIYSFRFGKPANHDQVLGLVGGVVFLCVIGTIFSEIFPIEFVMELQLIRSTWLINLFIMLYLANMIRGLLDSRPVQAWWAFGLIVALAIPRWILERTPINHPTPYALYVDFDTPWFTGQQSPFVWVLLSLVLFASLLVVWRMSYQDMNMVRSSKRTLGWFAFAVLSFTVPVFVQSGVPTRQNTTTNEWEATLLWIEHNTPRDALFVSPPTLDGFRVTAKRSNIGDWKDGTVGIFDNAWLIKWYKTMLDLGFNESKFSFSALDQKQLCYIAAKYRVDYAVIFKSWEIEAESVYENDVFTIIPIAKMTCSSDQPRETLVGQ